MAIRGMAAGLEGLTDEKQLVFSFLQQRKVWGLAESRGEQ